jgi:hypothetical protein
LNNRAKKLLAIFGFYVFLLGIGDVGLRLLYRLKDNGGSEATLGPSDKRADLAAYEGADYDPTATWREIKHGTAQWLNYQPYTVWTRKPTSGQYVNVDQDGCRVTAFNADEPEALRIWMIGGSTTWGMGVPDQETIPSRLAHLFNEAGVPTRVLNLGHTGFVSTQEVLSLVRELQKREAPDIFVVYDGLNEGLGLAERPDLPNPHYLMGRVSGLFESREVAQAPGTKGLAMGVLATTGYYRLAMSLRERLQPKGEVLTAATPDRQFRNDADIPAVAARSVEILLENYRLMQALGDGQGFPCFFFFQPHPGVGAKPLHASEVEVLATVNDDPESRWILEFSREQNRIFRQRLAAGEAPDGVFDVSDVFAEVTRPLYLDWAHLSHAGNRLVAAKLFEIIGRQICSGAAANVDLELRQRIIAACPDLPARAEGP